MKYLLDTHVIIWWLTEPLKIKKKARQIIADPNNSLFVSAASIWELAIKSKLGRIKLPYNLIETLNHERIQLLEISGQHALATIDLPLIHQDPFDRMLIAQAKYEDLILMTHDRVLQKYVVTSILA